MGWENGRNEKWLLGERVASNVAFSFAIYVKIFELKGPKLIQVSM